LRFNLPQPGVSIIRAAPHVAVLHCYPRVSFCEWGKDGRPAFVRGTVESFP
jgi:hypothetical protein